MPNEQDVRELVVIGAGPGGYAAAYSAADLGMKVTLIDKQPNPGGVCMYTGCIPSKFLLHIAKIVTDARKAEEMGVAFSAPTVDVERIRTQKNKVIKKLSAGLGGLCRQRKIEYIQAEACFVDRNSIELKTKRNSTQKISFERAIVATGSCPVKLPHVPADSPGVMDSAAALDVREIPETLLVIGGGYIGLELGSFYAGMGSRVTVVEQMPDLMTGSDTELIAILHKSLKKRFEAILLNTRCLDIREQRDGMKVRFEGSDQDKKERLFSKVLVAVGRRPDSTGIGLEHTKAELDEKGYIKVDKQQRSKDDAVFAIGDVAGQPQLAHKAMHEGIVSANVIAGREASFDPTAIPFVEFTEPEIAECGLSEKQAELQGRKIKAAKFPWQASGRAVTLGNSKGLTKLIIDPETDRILGAGIAGNGAADLIAEAALAVKLRATAADIAHTIHPHPTLSETLMEAADVFLGTNIHLPAAR